MSDNLFKKMLVLALLFQVCLHCSLYAQSTVTLEKDALKAVFVDNSAYGEHFKGYNGIAELFHKKQDSTLFVPEFSGVNLEHIFGGDSVVALFEPRRQPMSIKKISDTKVLLHQPETSISKVESYTTFEMVGSHYIDVEFRFIVHDKEMFKHEHVGFFWASYINLPEIIGINFKGKKNVNDKSRWVYQYSNEHGEKGTHIRDTDNHDFYIAPNFNIDLLVDVSEYRFTEPYYYGRFHNMVFAYLFDEPKEGVIRFSKSPNGAGDGKPAWDFQYILPDFEVKKEYSIKWRVLYKEWKSEKDIEKEYKRWAKNAA